MTKSFKHHEETIAKIKSEFSKDSKVLAVLLGGSIAHGYATETSDVDILIVVTEEEYQERKAENKLLYFNKDFCDRPDCYVDGKYLDLNDLRLVSEKGNEATRYAFKDSQFLVCHSDEVKELVKKISVFHESAKEENANRFYAQMLAWKWYYYEGKRHQNRVLISTAINNFILYSCRVLLNHNSLLYPYHKWMLAEVEKAQKKPKEFLKDLLTLEKSKKSSTLEKITREIKEMKVCDLGDWDWPEYFRKDVETVWMRQEPCLSDL